MQIAGAFEVGTETTGVEILLVGAIWRTMTVPRRRVAESEECSEELDEISREGDSDDDEGADEVVFRDSDFDVDRDM